MFKCVSNIISPGSVIVAFFPSTNRLFKGNFASLCLHRQDFFVCSAEVKFFFLSRHSFPLLYSPLYLHSSHIPFYYRLPILPVFHIGLFGFHNPVAFLHIEHGKALEQWIILNMINPTLNPAMRLQQGSTCNSKPYYRATNAGWGWRITAQPAAM